MTSGGNHHPAPRAHRFSPVFWRAAMIGAIHLCDAVQGIGGSVGVHQIHQDMDTEAC